MADEYSAITCSLTYAPTEASKAPQPKHTCEGKLDDLGKRITIKERLLFLCTSFHVLEGDGGVGDSGDKLEAYGRNTLDENRKRLPTFAASNKLVSTDTL